MSGSVDTLGETSSIESYEPAAEGLCPGSMIATAAGWIRDPGTGIRYNFISNGLFVQDVWRSLIFLPMNMSVYSWPAGPYGGYWSATYRDGGQSYSAGSPKIKIARGRGVCLGAGRVDFFNYSDVEVDDPNLKKAGMGPNAGNDPMDDVYPENCYEQFIIIERFIYGSGWHTITSGYVTVCYHG